MLTAALAVSAFVAGIAGAWSPCGFSVVETVGSARRRISLAASIAAFALGALVGGAATFGGLALAGSLAGGGRGWWAVGTVAGTALAAAVAEARGTRIVPQIRRQLPEPWRRRLPLPVASCAYGVLLGLGFATFVLTFAFWALVIVVLLLGDPALGLVVGVAFGAGRALPIAAVAPLAERPAGREIVDAMATRPGILRGVRLAAALALAAVAASLLAAGASADVVARGATDPTVDGGAVAWDGAGTALLRYEYRPGDTAHHLGALTTPLPGRHPAAGGGLLAWKQGALVRVVRQVDFSAVVELSLPRADALAISSRWLAYRERRTGADRLAVRSLSAPDEERTVAATAPNSALGRPALDGDVLVYHVASPRASRVVAVTLPAGKARVVRSSRRAQLTNPSARAGALLFVRQSSLGQELVLGRLDRPRADRVLLRMPSTAARDSGHEPGYSHVTRSPKAAPPAKSMLWTTALGARVAYVTLLPVRGGIAGSRIVRVRR